MPDNKYFDQQHMENLEMNFMGAGYFWIDFRVGFQVLLNYLFLMIIIIIIILSCKNKIVLLLQKHIYSLSSLLLYALFSEAPLPLTLRPISFTLPSGCLNT